MSIFKKILIGALLLIVVLLAVLCIALYSILANIDLNEHKHMISEQLQQQTGYHLTIAGDIQHTLYPRLGISTTQITIDDTAKPNGAPLLKMASLKMQVKLLPLLQKQIEIDKLQIHGVTLQLEEKKQNENRTIAPLRSEKRRDNNQTTDAPHLKLAHTKNDAGANITEPKNKQETQLPFHRFALGGVDIRDITVNWTGRDQQLILERLNIGELVYGQAITLDAVLRAKLDQPKIDGIVNIAGAIRYTNAGEQITLSPLTIDITSDALTDTRLATGKNTQKATDTIRIGADISLDLPTDTLDIARLFVAGLGLDINANAQYKMADTSFSGTLSMAAINPRKLMQVLNKPLPPLANTALNKAALPNVHFHGTNQQLNIEEIEAVLDDTTIKGMLVIDDFNKPAYRFAVNIDNVDIDRYLPQEQQTQPVTPETITGAAAMLPPQTLRPLDIKGKIHIGTLLLSGLKASDIKAEINGKDGHLKLDPISAQLYDGRYQAAILLDARGEQTQLAVKSALNDVNLGLLLADLADYDDLSGTGSLTLSLTTQGNDTDALIENISGDGAIALQKGGFKGFDVKSIVKQLKTLYKSGKIDRIDKGKQTEFAALTGTIIIKRGLVHVDDLLITVSELININGQGILFDLKNETWDYGFTINADDTINAQIQCRGKLAQKDCRLNAKDSARKWLEGKLKDQLEKEKLKEKLIDRLKIKIPRI